MKKPNHGGRPPAKQEESRELGNVCWPSIGTLQCFPPFWFLQSFMTNKHSSENYDKGVNEDDNETICCQCSNLLHFPTSNKDLNVRFIFETLQNNAFYARSMASAGHNTWLHYVCDVWTGVSNFTMFKTPIACIGYHDVTFYRFFLS